MDQPVHPLKCLLVEDSGNDAFLLQAHLTAGGLAAETTCVDSREALQQCLSSGGWDFVLTDYCLPGLDGLSVVRMVQAVDPELPCIVVSGQVGEEEAVQVMRAGAKDCISKSNLARLVSSVRRELLFVEEHRAAQRSRVRLLESEARFKAISGAAQDGIVMMDPQGRVTFWNAAAERIFGFTAEEIIGQDLHRAIAPASDQGTFRSVFPNFVDTGEGNVMGRTIQVLALAKDRREICVELSVSKVLFQNGWHGIAIARDITRRIALESERAMMELQLNQAQKMEAVGQLAAGIAHEINTPIQYVGDNTLFLRDSCGEVLAFLAALQSAWQAGPMAEPAQAELRSQLNVLDLHYLQEEIPKAIQQSQEGVLRVAKIVAALKDFSHPSMGVKAPADLNRAIESTVLVCRNEWKYLAEMELDLDPELSSVSCFADEFNQVVLNLVINAAHAIESAAAERGPGSKGRIRISTRSRGRHVEIQVADNGTGIPAAIRTRVFAPFFTTKPAGKGTGQGLAIARSIIVDRHGGSIRFETEPGQGTTFILELPLGTA